MNAAKRLALVCAAAAFGAALLAGLGGAPAQEAKAPAAAPRPDGGAPQTELRVVERVNTATDRALDYLEAQQVKTGADAGMWEPNAAVNALAMLAYLSRGHVPGRGKYGDVVDGDGVRPGVLRRGKNYLLSKATPVGNPPPAGQPDARPVYIANNGGQHLMYEHGLSTLCLAELYGMDPDPRLEETLRRAVDLIVKAQSPNGGWRYNYTPGDHDLSVTVMQVVALRAAANAEIPVPAATFEKAIEYVRGRGHPNGGYGYQGPEQRPPTTAAGALSLQLLGKYDDPGVHKALVFLGTLPQEWEKNQNPYFYYFNYYAIQAHYQAGGKEWNEWHPRVREVLLSHQNPDGSWNVPPGSQEPGANNPADKKIYSTAMATVILNIYMHYLPAYQR